MRKIKAMRKKMISLTLIIAMVLPLCLANGMPNVFASETKDTFVPNEVSQEQKVAITNYKADIEEFVKPIFGDRAIKTCEYLYNLDDSSDYIYVEFETGGYVVYAKETMEMMEYSLKGGLPYTSTAKKYYAGPSNYFHKSSEQFHDILSGQKITIKESEMKEVAQQVRNVTIDNNVEKFDVQSTNNFTGEYESRSQTNTIHTNSMFSLSIDYDNLIIASKTTGTLIPNYKYFIKDPTIGSNDETMCGNGNSGTCGAVAAQLLLGYHNYYNDRRIIPDRYLLGYDDENECVAVKGKNPNYCTEPMKMTFETLGTRSESVEGEDNNSFYIQMVTKIMSPATVGATIIQVENGIQQYLNTRLSLGSYSIESRETTLGLGLVPIDSSYIKGEINAGRPVIIAISGILSNDDNQRGHYVVGYGYQNYTQYSDGSMYEGYVVHVGYRGDVCVWINSAWCYGYVSLNIEHNHQYYGVKPIETGSGFEYKCSICGHRTDAIVNVANHEVYIELTSNLIQSEYKEFRITFQTAGNRIFQTYGNEDTVLYLYDTEHNLLISNDDDGDNSNAYFNYAVQSGKTYILRVKFHSRAMQGDVKIGITAGPDAFPIYENITSESGINGQFAFNVLANRADVCVFIPSENGFYEIEYSFATPTEGYALLYVIDPRSMGQCLSNDNGTGIFSNTITAQLSDGVPYYIVVGDNDMSAMGDMVCLSVNKLP